MKFNLKVFMNKKNGQGLVYLPKKMLNSLPPKVELKVDEGYLKKILK